MTRCALEAYERSPDRELEALLAEIRVSATRRGLDDVAAAIDAGIARKVGPAAVDAGGPGEDAQEG